MGGEGRGPALLRKRVAMVGQNPFHQLLHKSVGANVESARRRAPWGAALAFEEAVRLLSVGPLLRRDVETLSFGEAQRVAFLCALLRAPELLIVDELFAALDAAGIDAFVAALSAMRGRGRAPSSSRTSRRISPRSPTGSSPSDRGTMHRADNVRVLVYTTIFGALWGSSRRSWGRISTSSTSRSKAL